MTASPAPARPRVRVVVVNYDGGEMTVECLEALRGTDWPSNRLEVVLVDNASSDGIADRVAAELPDVEVLRSATNLGFGGGCNLGIGDPGGADYVALVNNDVSVEPGWPTPVVEELEADESLGDACPGILFPSRFAEVQIDALDRQRAQLRHDAEHCVLGRTHAAGSNTAAAISTVLTLTRSGSSGSGDRAGLGLFHVTNQGAVSWFERARATLECAGEGLTGWARP